MLNIRNRDKSNADDNDPRREEINDVMDSDIRANRRVNDNTRKWIGLFVDDIKETPQLDRNTAQKTQKDGDRITKSLMDIRQRLNQVMLIRYDSFYKPLNKDVINKALLYSDPVLLYNDLIRSYKDREITFTTKEAIKTQIQTVSPFINDICYLIDRIITRKLLMFEEFEDVPRVPRGPRGDEERKGPERQEPDRAPTGRWLYMNLATYNADEDQNSQEELSAIHNADIYLLQFLNMSATFNFIQTSLLRNDYELVNDENVEIELQKKINSYPEDTKEYIQAVIGDDIQNRTLAQEQAFNIRKRLIEEDNKAPLDSAQTSAIRNSIFGVPDRSNYVINPNKRLSIEQILDNNADNAHPDFNRLLPEQVELYRDILSSYDDYTNRNDLETADRIRGLDLRLQTMDNNIRNGNPPDFVDVQEVYRGPILKPDLPLREQPITGPRGNVILTTDQQIDRAMEDDPRISGIIEEQRRGKVEPLIREFNNNPSLVLPFNFTNNTATNKQLVRNFKTICANFWKAVYRLNFGKNPSGPITNIYSDNNEASYPEIAVANINRVGFLNDLDVASREVVNDECGEYKRDTLLLADDYVNENVLSSSEKVFLKNKLIEDMRQQERRSQQGAIIGQGRRNFKHYSDLDYNDNKNEMFDDY